MIIIDFNAVAVSEGMTLCGYEKNITSHDIAGVALSRLGQLSAKFKREYGATIVCCEGRGNWRKTVYPLYKKNRKASKDKSRYDWDMMYDGFNLATDIINNDLQWLVMQVPMTEADDCIAVLARASQEKTLIVSRDSDFFQLHNANIQQFDFVTKKMLKGDRGQHYFHEKYVRGSAKENIANIQMPIDHLTEGDGRQKAITKKFLSTLVLDGALRVRYEENKALMDLSAIPDDIQESIIVEYKQKIQEPTPSIKSMGEALYENNFRILARNVEDFID